MKIPNTPNIVIKAFFIELKKALKEELSKKDENIIKVEKRKEMDFRNKLIKKAKSKEELDRELKKPFKTNEELFLSNNAAKKDRRKFWADRGFRTMGPIIGAAVGASIGGFIGLGVGLFVGALSGYAIQKTMMNFVIPTIKAFKRAKANSKKAYKYKKGRQKNAMQYEGAKYITTDDDTLNSKQKNPKHYFLTELPLPTNANINPEQLIKDRDVEETKIMFKRSQRVNNTKQNPPPKKHLKNYLVNKYSF